MATSIHNVLAINATGVNNVTTRTYTTTRALRVIDLIAVADTTNAGVGQPRVTDGTGNIINITLPGAGSVENRIYRAGGSDGVGGRLATTYDDARALVAAGGTIVFSGGVAGSDYRMTCLCITQ